MMFIVRFGFTGIRFKRGVLFGNYEKHPLTTLSLLVVTITRVTSGGDWLFRKALNGLAQDDEWHIKNAKSLRLAKKKARSKARAQAEARMRETVDMYKDSYSKAQEKLIKAQQENRAMREVIKIAGNVQEAVE